MENRFGFPLRDWVDQIHHKSCKTAVHSIIAIQNLTVMVYVASLWEMHIWRVINKKQCVLWRVLCVCLGIINITLQEEKKSLFFGCFALLLHICQAQSTVIKEHRFFFLCKHCLMISSKWIWSVWDVFSFASDLCCNPIYVMIDQPCAEPAQWGLSLVSELPNFMALSVSHSQYIQWPTLE